MKKDPIQFADFAKLDLRVGLVNQAENVEKSTKLVRLHVEFGDDFGQAIILTGLQQFYKPEDFVGKKFIFLTNLEPKAMMGETSNGMIFAADAGEDGAILIPAPDELVPGTIVR